MTKTSIFAGYRHINAIDHGAPSIYQTVFVKRSLPFFGGKGNSSFPIQMWSPDLIKISQVGGHLTSEQQVHFSFQFPMRHQSHMVGHFLSGLSWCRFLLSEPFFFQRVFYVVYYYQKPLLLLRSESWGFSKEARQTFLYELPDIQVMRQEIWFTTQWISAQKIVTCHFFQNQFSAYRNLLTPFSVGTVSNKCIANT